MLLACVMVAGYLGLLPALRQLAPSPVWPDQPGTVIGAVGAVKLDRLVVAGPPTKKPHPAIHKVHQKPRTTTTLASSSSSNAQVSTEPVGPNPTFDPGGLASQTPPPDPTCQGAGC